MLLRCKREHTNVSQPGGCSQERGARLPTLSTEAPDNLCDTKAQMAEESSG